MSVRLAVVKAEEATFSGWLLEIRKHLGVDASLPAPISFSVSGPERVISDENTSPRGSPTPFADEHRDQTFSKGSELSVDNIVHTHPLRCVFPGCKFSGGPYQTDIDWHMREKHGTRIGFDPESFLAEASTKTLPADKSCPTNQPDREEVEYIPREYSVGEAKLSPAGQLLGGRVFLIPTFVLP
ncbi:hypothetical protein BDR22DRAFT_966925 [Usnea florida]